MGIQHSFSWGYKVILLPQLKIPPYTMESTLEPIEEGSVLHLTLFGVDPPHPMNEPVFHKVPYTSLLIRKENIFTPWK